MTLFRAGREQDPGKELDLNAVFNWINGFSDVIEFTVAVGGTEVAVPHDMESVPASVIRVVTESATGQGVVFPGSTAWTETNVYLTATVAGDYAVILRRE